MRKSIICLLALCLLTTKSVGQGIGTWQSHLSYHNTTAVAETNQLVFALANKSLYSYDKGDNSIRFYSSLSGLSDTYINQIAYNEETDKLVITYESGNIDLLQPGTNNVKNLPFMKEDIMLQDQTVSSIYIFKEFAYLTTPFGIVVVNTKKEEIADTYKLQIGITSTCINGSQIYAASTKGVLQASLTSNLSDYHNWLPYSINLPQADTDSIRQIGFFSDVFTFFVNRKVNKGLYYKQTDGTIKTISRDNNLTGFTVQNNKLIAYGSSFALILSSFTDQIQFKNSPVNGVSTLKDASTFWIASGNAGLKGIRRKGDTFELIVSDLNTDSPLSNLDAFMTFHNQKLLVVGGDRFEERRGNPFILMTYENGKWYNFDYPTIRKASGLDFIQDATSVAVDPLDENHYFVSTWGEGVVELKDNTFVTLHNHMNSTLQTAVAGNAYHYVRVEGLCFDKDNNLWMTNSSVSNGIKVLKADGTWKAFSGELNGIHLIDKILITKNNHKWINVLRSPSKVVVFDDNATIDDETDDRIRTINTFYQTSSNGTTTINASMYNCIVEDKKNGALWIGTNIGPIICYNPKKAIDNPADNVTVFRPVRTADDGLDGYLLDGEDVKVIAIDGGNRKWLGTKTGGVFVISDDGSETIYHFNTDNSPLPSNNINSMAINPVNGEVFIGTDKGMVSYLSGATEGKESYSEVYAYPNPVRPGHNDQVTITGLMADSNVKITDISGNLIYQAKSVGGHLTWNCQNNKGQRVATGIYLVLASQPDQGESVVTKIMVIK